MVVSLKVNQQLSYNTVSPVLGICSREIKVISIQRVDIKVTAALFELSKTGNDSNTCQ